VAEWQTLVVYTKVTGSNPVQTNQKIIRMKFGTETWKTHATLWIFPLVGIDYGEGQDWGDWKWILHLGWLRWGISIKAK